MPNHKTFSIKPIAQLIERHTKNVEGRILDPFANSCTIGNVTNDLDPGFDTDYTMDALDFLKMQDDNSAEVVLYDPPYSPRQVSECYRSLGKTVNMKTTQASFWGNLKKEIARIVVPEGVVLSFGWNSGGIGKTLGFTLIEILLVPHGGAHCDTICTVEVRNRMNQEVFDFTGNK
jgi:hypothetical protein